MAESNENRFQTWVCSRCFDAYESAGQFAGMARYPENEQPKECDACRLAFIGDSAYSIFVEP